MNFKLKLYLATRTQDARLLDLLRFPAEPVLRGKAEWSAQWWSHGKTKRMRSTDREKILQKIAADGINELQLKCRTQPTSMGSGGDPRVTEAWLWFDPSPSSQLWATVPTVKCENREDERSRKTFHGGQSYREEHRNGPPRPSELECVELVVETDKGATDFELQSVSIDLICAAIPARLASQDIFGIGCLHDGGEHGNPPLQRMTHSLGGVREWEDQLGVKFENIYPILIGPMTACEGLAAVIGDRGSLIRISDGAPSAIVSIRPDKVEEVRHEPAVKEWVIIRDYKGDPSEVAEEMFRRGSALPWLAPFVKR
jgi:hypothetical protein